jgi:uncharacterized protein (DUF2249 family)
MSIKLNGAPASLGAACKTAVVELDVRPILRDGGEPFSAIMEAVGKIANGGALRLRATFEPKPLFRVLASKGLNHWLEHGEGDDWIIWFYREAAGVKPSSGLSREDKGDLLRDYPELETRLQLESDTWTLDVKRMSPPEPMELTLAVVQKLPQGVKLVQVNERIPQFLFPMLEEQGLVHKLLSDDGQEVRIEIAHATCSEASMGR